MGQPEPRLGPQEAGDGGCLEMSSMASQEPLGPRGRGGGVPWEQLPGAGCRRAGRDRNQTCFICLPFPDTLGDKRVECLVRRRDGVLANRGGRAMGPVVVGAAFGGGRGQSGPVGVVLDGHVGPGALSDQEWELGGGQVAPGRAVLFLSQQEGPVPLTPKLSSLLKQS